MSEPITLDVPVPGGVKLEDHAAEYFGVPASTLSAAPHPISEKVVEAGLSNVLFVGIFQDGETLLGGYELRLPENWQEQDSEEEREAWSQQDGSTVLVADFRPVVQA